MQGRGDGGRGLVGACAGHSEGGSGGPPRLGNPRAGAIAPVQVTCRKGSGSLSQVPGSTFQDVAPCGFRGCPTS